MNRQKRAGDQTEREAEGILRDLLGVPARRKLGAGRQDDMGDMDGVLDTTVQVVRCLAMSSLATVATAKAKACDVQQDRAGTTHGVTLLRATTPVGIRWRAILTDRQAAATRAYTPEWTWAESTLSWPDSWLIALGPDVGPVRVRGLWVMAVNDWAAFWREA